MSKLNQEKINELFSVFHNVTYRFIASKIDEPLFFKNISQYFGSDVIKDDLYCFYDFYKNYSPSSMVKKDKFCAYASRILFALQLFPRDKENFKIYFVFNYLIDATNKISLLNEYSSDDDIDFIWSLLAKVVNPNQKTLSKWIVVDEFCHTRVFSENSENPDVQFRVAFIEKTPRINAITSLENGWVYGNKGSYDYPELSKEWCDHILSKLEYVLL